CVPPAQPPPRASTLSPYTTLFRSRRADPEANVVDVELGPRQREARVEDERALPEPERPRVAELGHERVLGARTDVDHVRGVLARSEEHTSELQSRENLVCRLPLEK